MITFVSHVLRMQLVSLPLLARRQPPSAHHRPRLLTWGSNQPDVHTREDARAQAQQSFP